MVGHFGFGLVSGALGSPIFGSAIEEEALRVDRSFSSRIQRVESMVGSSHPNRCFLDTQLGREPKPEPDQIPHKASSCTRKSGAPSCIPGREQPDTGAN